jgi:predicted AAA+ superfamily ATPase
MAKSNRDRIHEGMELLTAGLRPFVDSVMSAGAPDGRDWLDLVEARDNAKHGTSMPHSKDDPRLLLRMITEEWRLFTDHLSRVEQNFASELRDVGNKFAHGEAFTSDDTYRVMDTMERLLTAVGATSEADQVRKLRRDAQQAVYSEENRKARDTMIPGGVNASFDGHSLKSWREVILPHSDVRKGNLRGAEFAADLYYVSQGEGSREYIEPAEFFRRTYLTEGLRDLLSWAARRIGGDMNAPPVVNLQTNFGGGKTHSMLALWHLASSTPLRDYPDELQHLLRQHDSDALHSASHAALVGNHISVGKGSDKSDGTHVKTLWGELAWQLGASRGGETEARKAYAIVADADQTRTNPADALGRLIHAYAPCLILIDEWVAYSRQLVGNDDLDAGSFDTQFTFAQTLTEAVKAVPGAMLVVSIPASSEKPNESEKERGVTELEVGGTNGLRALDRLQQVIRRVADQWRPATPLESFSIVRQRLFDDPGASTRADIAAIARAFTDFYAKNKADFPAGVADPSYEQRIKDAYPLHPELFDRLFQDWSTLEKFQRTRGVLRMMSQVIYTLWKNDDPAPLIMPGGLPLDASDVLTEISGYLDDNFKPVVETDVDGENPTPAKIDAARTLYGQRRITRRIARTIFFGSAPTLKAAHKGIEKPYIWLGMATPGDTVAHFDSALHMLSDQATYLFNDGARYWYDVHQSVNRMAREHADRLKDRPEEIWHEILTRITDKETSARGMFARVQAGPDHDDEIPDDPIVRLVILHPRYRHVRGDEMSDAMKFAMGALTHRGNSPRMNRNMVVFLAPDSKRYDELDQAVRDFLAWKHIAGRIKELDLTAHQADQAEQKFRSANETVNQRITGTYQWLLAPVQRAADQPVAIDQHQNSTGKDRLAERVSEKLHNLDELRTVHGAGNIKIELDKYLASVWKQGHIRVGDLWDYYCKYVYLHRLRDRSVLENGILSVFDMLTWDYEGFAVAQGYDEANGKYLHLAIPHQDSPPQITDGTLLVQPELASAQREAELAEAQARRAEAAAAHGDDGTGTVSAPAGQAPTFVMPNGTGSASAAPSAPAIRNTRFYGSVRLDPERYARDFTRLGQEIIQHLALDGAELEITVDITAAKPDGYPDDKVRIVMENARVLKFEPFDFEDK